MDGLLWKKSSFTPHLNLPGQPLPFLRVLKASADKLSEPVFAWSSSRPVTCLGLLHPPICPTMVSIPFCPSMFPQQVTQLSAAEDPKIRSDLKEDMHPKKFHSS